MRDASVFLSYIRIVVDQVEEKYVFTFHTYGLMKGVFRFLLEQLVGHRSWQMLKVLTGEIILQCNTGNTFMWIHRFEWTYPMRADQLTAVRQQDLGTYFFGYLVEF